MKNKLNEIKEKWNTASKRTKILTAFGVVVLIAVVANYAA